VDSGESEVSETQDDRATEVELAEVLGDCLNLEICRQPPYSRFDFSGFIKIEAKGRSHEYGDWPDCFVDLDKWKSLSGGNGILVVGWACGTIGYVYHRDQDYRREEHRMHNRGVDYHKMVACIPIGEFEIIREAD